MNGVYLKFFVQENLRHDGRLLYEWLIDIAIELKLPGCSVFRAIAGYGHHQQRHQQAFIELQGTLPLEVVFALFEDDAERLLQRITADKLTLFYIRSPVEYGFTGT